MRIRVLGSAAGGGFPQWNCNCANCRAVRDAEPGVVARTQSSLAISADGRQWYLLNASPDIGRQLRDTPELQPRGDAARNSPIAGVVLTNADVDHVAGLLTLRERQPMSLISTGRILDVLDANPIFGVLDPDVVRRERLALDHPKVLPAGDDACGALTVTAFSVPGKVALWMEAITGGDLRGGGEDTIGITITAAGSDARCVYVPGCAAMTAELAARLRGADLVFFDGTTWSDDEMRTSGVGSKTAGRMGHMCMSGADGSMAAFAALGVRRKVFIHINNTNPVLRPNAPERRLAEQQGWEIAADGQEFVLGGELRR